MPIPFSSTKGGRAYELLKRLEKGPDFSGFSKTITIEEAQRLYRLWSGCWVIPEARALLPLPKAKEKKE